jgi:hypothetical protein
MAESIIAEALKKAGGIGAVAKALDMSEEGVRLWRARDNVPANNVLWLSERTDWAFTPHQLAPELYPHPDDGLPPEHRAEQVA